MYVCMYVCTHVCIHVSIHVWPHVYIYVCVCIHTLSRPEKSAILLSLAKILLIPFELLQVLRLKMKDGSVTHMEEVYAEDGHMVYGSSVANYYRGSMLIGTVHHKVAYCQVFHMD